MVLKDCELTLPNRNAIVVEIAAVVVDEAADVVAAVTGMFYFFHS